LSTIEKLPKWASLLLTLLIGVAFTFGGQLFTAMAVNGGNTAPKICTVDDGAPKSGQTKFKVGTKLGTSDDDKALQGLKDPTKFHMTCKN
jgi:hypothetical protein